MELKVIVYATDGSPSSRKALEVAAGLVRGKDARLVIVHVQAGQTATLEYAELAIFERIEQVHLSGWDVLREAAQRVVAEAEAAARILGFEHIQCLVLDGNPARRILETAKEQSADAIVMGSRGRGDLQGLLLGSVSHKVAHLAPCTCIIVR